MNAVWIYRSFDVAQEIDLNRVEDILRARKPASRLRLAGVHPKSIQMPNPPVSVELADRRLRVGPWTFMAGAAATVYDLGAISIVLKLPVDGWSYDELKQLAIHLAGSEELEPVFAGELQEIVAELAPALNKAKISHFSEDFTVFFFRQWQPDWDPVPLLLAEAEEVSRQWRQEVLRHSFTYGKDDLTIINWDAALVYDAGGSRDIPDLLDFANIQLLELRYYDELLNQEMERMYDAVAEVGRGFWWSRLGRYRRLMRRLMRLVVEVTEITGRIENTLTVTEDVFYARVYAAALAILRTRTWMDGIEAKVGVVQRTYAMLSEELENHQANFLEAVIIILIALEIMLGLLRLL